MPLMETIGPNARMQMRLKGQFEELPTTDQVNVIKLIQLGQRHVDPEAIEAEAIPELSEQGQAFIKNDLFRELYDVRTHRAPPPPDNMAGSEINPVMRGLLDVIKTLAGPQAVLDPDKSNRMGAKEEGKKEEKDGLGHHTCPQCKFKFGGK